MHKVYEPVSVYKKPEPVYEPVYKPDLVYKKPEVSYEPLYKPDIVFKKPEPVYEPVFSPVPVYKKLETHFKPSPPLHALEPVFKPFTTYKPQIYKTPKYKAPKLVSLKIEPHPYHQIVKPISNPYSHKPKIQQTLGFLSPRPAVLPSVFEPTYKLSKEEVEVNIHEVPKWIKTTAKPITNYKYQTISYPSPKPFFHREITHKPFKTTNQTYKFKLLGKQDEKEAPTESDEVEGKEMPNEDNKGKASSQFKISPQDSASLKVI